MDDVQQRLAGGEAAQVLRDHVPDLLLKERRLRRAVRRQQHVRGVAQRVVGRQRLDVEHVERGAADPSGGKGAGQRCLVDQAAARHVDQHRLWLAALQKRVVDQPFGPLVQPQREDDEVEVGKRVMQLLEADPAVRQLALRVAGSGRPVGELLPLSRASERCHQPHAEHAAEPPDLPADRPVADDADGRAAQHRRRHLRLAVAVPGAAPLMDEDAAKPMREEQHRPQGPFGDRHRGRAAAVTDLDAGRGDQRVGQVLVAGVQRLHPAQARHLPRLGQPRVADQPLDLAIPVGRWRLGTSEQLNALRDAAGGVAKPRLRDLAMRTDQGDRASGARV